MDFVLRNIHFSSTGLFAVTWITFALGAIASFIIQLRRGNGSWSLKKLLEHAFPVDRMLSRSSRIDVLFYIVSKLSEHLTGAAYAALQIVLATALSEFLNRIFHVHQTLHVDIFVIMVISLLLFLVSDFANFLSHYLQHFVPVLWELHKVHHSATFMTPLTTKRMHPLGNEFDNIVATLFVVAPMALARSLAGLNFLEMAVLISNANMIGTIIVLDALRHSTFQISFGPLDRVFLSPFMHQIHHSYLKEHWDRNFGNKLSIWDGLFGTAIYPKPGEETPWGLGKPEEEDYNDVIGAYVGPLVKIGRRVAGTTGEERFLDRVLWRRPG